MKCVHAVPRQWWYDYMEATFRFLLRIDDSACYEDALEHLALWLDDLIEAKDTLGTYTRGHVEIYLWNLKRARHATIVNTVIHEWLHHAIANATRAAMERDGHWAIYKLIGA